MKWQLLPFKGGIQIQHATGLLPVCHKHSEGQASSQKSGGNSLEIAKELF